MKRKLTLAAREIAESFWLLSQVEHPKCRPRMNQDVKTFAA